MVDHFRDERGRLKKGAPPLFKGGKQAQPDNQPTQSDLEPLPSDPNNFYAALLYVARNHGRSDLPRVSMVGVCLDLKEERPVEYYQHLSKASSAKAEESYGGGNYSTTVVFDTAPSGWCIDENGKLVEPAQAKAEWERKHNMTFTAEPPPQSAQPTLVPPRVVEDHTDDDEYNEPPYTVEEVNQMTKAEFDAAVAAGEIVLVDKEP